MEQPLGWLLEADNPSARALTLKHLLDRPAGDADLAAARAAIPAWGPARDTLAAQWPGGYWMAPGAGYSPRHRATVWQVIFLAALGAPRTAAIDAACAYILDHSRLPDGRFCAGKTAGQATAGLNGSLLRAFGQLGYEDPRLNRTAQALAEMVLRLRPGRQRDLAEQGADRGDAARALAGLAALPASSRPPEVDEALGAMVDVLLAEDGRALLAGQAAPGRRDEWQRFGFPPADTADLLEAMEALVEAGQGADPRLAAARQVVRDKRDRDGRWALERAPDNTWASFGQVGRPDKWITLRALRVLKMEEPG